MIIALDIDNIISSPVSNFMALNDAERCELKTGAKEAIDRLVEMGHRILIYSNRDASLSPATQYWLQKNKIHYDQIIFNKPYYDILIDPKSYKFSEWEEFLNGNKYRLQNSN